MAFIEWQDAYSVGSERFDADHKTFIDILNRLYDASASNRDALTGLLQELRDYAAGHFRREEELMAGHAFAGLEHHRRQHQAFVDKIDDARGRLGQIEPAELVDFLQDWLLNHILEADMQYRGLFETRQTRSGGFRISDVSIRLRLVVGSGVFALILSAAVGASVWSVGNLGGFIASLTERRMPSTVAGLGIVNEVNASLAALRGWMLTGQPAYKDDRAAVWRTIDGHVAKLDASSAGWNDAEASARWAETRTVLGEFRAAQERVEGIAHSPQEQPALRLLEDQAAPLMHGIFGDITAMIDEERTLEATAERKALLADMADVRGTGSMAAANLRAYLLSGADAAWKDADALWQRNQAAFDRLNAASGLLSDTQAKALARISAARGGYAALLPRLHDLRRSERWNEALYLLRTEAAPRAEKLLTLLSGERQAGGVRAGGIVDRQSTALAREAGLVRVGAADLVRNEWLILAVGLLLSTGFALFMIRSIVAPLHDMVATMKRLAGGSLDVAIAALGRRDELGAMAEAVQVFKENAVQNARLRAAQETLIRRTKEEGRRTLVRIADNFESSVLGVVGQVAGAADGMKHSASDMAGAADQSNRLADGAQAAAQQAALNVETVAAATEELSASIGEIGRQVDQAARISGDAVAKANRTNDIVTALSQAVGRIGEVVRLIDEIASQTNLLALNATIEAARAGEAGKGFAVVANEVKGLANQTAKATGDIAQQIAAVQSNTRDAVDAIASISGVIGEVSRISAAIAAAVEEQSAATREIARNVEEAAGGTRRASDNISGVAATVETTRAAAGSVLASAEALSGQAETLRRQVEGFIARIRNG